MRPEFDRQFDSLLREHARRGRVAPRDGGDDAPARDARQGGREASAAHLDADELSAFAENALPASTRARHTAHLADCGDCRRLVSQLALAAGVADEIERREPSRAAGLAGAAVASPAPAWGERLAALFRPGAWRYALPLAALLVVSAAVLLLLTNNRRRDELGQLATTRDDARPSQPAEMNHAAASKQQADADAAATNQNTAADNSAAGADARSEEARPPDSRTPDGVNQIAPSAPVVGGSQVVPSDAAKRPAAEVAPPPPAFAAELAATPTPLPPPSQQTSDLAAVASRPAPAKSDDDRAAENKEKDRLDERERARARTQRGHGPMRNETQQQMNARNRQNEEAQTAADGARKSDDAKTSESNASRAAAAPAAARAETRREKSGAGRGDDAEGGVETRNVGGRRFRRQGGAWVDTSYQPSQATVQIGRGSEQYRSLVGDEPALGRIANALGGEVIVVWKGRAYRIR